MTANNPTATKLDPQWLANKTFDLYQSHGVPIEISEYLIEKEGLILDVDYLQKLIDSHQTLSQNSSTAQFKSGLGSNSPKAIAMHTATHILHQVLRSIFGTQLQQMGSAILEDKARFDININSSDLTPETITNIEAQVQAIIDKNLTMTKIETTPEIAKELNAIGLFGEKYGDKVTIYTLEDGQTIYSREFCGGPHIENTSQIGKFQILKKKSIGNNLTRLDFVVSL